MYYYFYLPNNILFSGTISRISYNKEWDVSSNVLRIITIKVKKIVLPVRLFISTMLRGSN